MVAARSSAFEKQNASAMKLPESALVERAQNSVSFDIDPSYVGAAGPTPFTSNYGSRRPATALCIQRRKRSYAWRTAQIPYGIEAGFKLG